MKTTHIRMPRYKSDPQQRFASYNVLPLPTDTLVGYSGIITCVSEVSIEGNEKELLVRLNSTPQDGMRRTIQQVKSFQDGKLLVIRYKDEVLNPTFPPNKETGDSTINENNENDTPFIIKGK